MTMTMTILLQRREGGPGGQRWRHRNNHGKGRGGKETSLGCSDVMEGAKNFIKEEGVDGVIEQARHCYMHDELSTVCSILMAVVMHALYSDRMNLHRGWSGSE